MKPIRAASALGRRYHMRPTPANHPLAKAPRVAPQVGELPPSVDMSPLFPGIRDQGQEGACTGFATAGLRETLWGSSTGQKLDHRLSPAYLYARTRMAEGTFPFDDGATMADEFAVLSGFGVCPEDDLKYTGDPAEGPTPLCDAAAVAYRVGEPLRVDRSTPDSVKAVLAAGMPVGISIPVYQSFEATGWDGVVALPNAAKEALLGGHGLFLMGYDSRGYLGANSWNTTWGDHGFFHMPYGWEQVWWEAWCAAKA